MSRKWSPFGEPLGHHLGGFWPQNWRLFREPVLGRLPGPTLRGLGSLLGGFGEAISEHFWEEILAKKRMESWTQMGLQQNIFRILAESGQNPGRIPVQSHQAPSRVQAESQAESQADSLQNPSQNPNRIPAEPKQNPSRSVADSQQNPNRMPAESQHAPSRILAEFQHNPIRISAEFLAES